MQARHCRTLWTSRDYGSIILSSSAHKLCVIDGHASQQHQYLTELVFAVKCLSSGIPTELNCKQ
eukprot:scaffold8440_cov33-Prasinocladus_malaysianus.AAC.1